MTQQTCLDGVPFRRHEPRRDLRDHARRPAVHNPLAAIARLEALGGASPDELPTNEGLLRAGARAGLEPTWVATSSQRDWEDYEWTLIANCDAYVRANPGARAVRDWIDRARTRLLAPGGRDTIGFALIVFRGAVG